MKTHGEKERERKEQPTCCGDAGPKPQQHPNADGKFASGDQDAERGGERKHVCQKGVDGTYSGGGNQALIHPDRALFA